jgi:hypothetical protein
MNATMDKYLGEGVEMASKEAGYNMVRYGCLTIRDDMLIIYRL